MPEFWRACRKLSVAGIMLFATTVAVLAQATGAQNADRHSLRAELVELKIEPDQAEMVRAGFPRFSSDEEVEVPFTRFKTPSYTARLLMIPAEIRSTMEITGLGRLTLPRKGVPVAMVEFEPGRLSIVFRESFSGRLFLYRISETGVLEHESRIVADLDAEFILRGITVSRGQIIAVLYDNAKGVNEIVMIDPLSADAEFLPRKLARLPSMEDPAGGTYEMIPKVHFVDRDGETYLFAGNFYTLVRDMGGEIAEVWRLPECVRVLEVVRSGNDFFSLCPRRLPDEPHRFRSANLVTDESEPVFVLVRCETGGSCSLTSIANEQGIPTLDDDGKPQFAETASEIADILKRDLLTLDASGVAELGVNNQEGRSAWSQIYYLNGLLDMIKLVTSDDVAAKAFVSLAWDAKRRLDIELSLLDQLLRLPEGYETKGFTVGREPALFAVQTSRLLLLFNRYSREIEQGAVLTQHVKLRDRVLYLAGHIEEVAIAAEDSTEPVPGRRYLRWPKGSAFYFDGLNVPYNHQNEWAYAVFDTLAGGSALQPRYEDALSLADDIITQFIAYITQESLFPSSGTWPYWWGQASKGWTVEEAISVHMPEYAGDRLIAWISFRSIDVMSILAAKHFVPSAATSRLRADIADLVGRGLVFPFVGSAFAPNEKVPLANRAVALSHFRVTSPVDLQSSVWAGLSLLRSGR